MSPALTSAAQPGRFALMQWVAASCGVIPGFASTLEPGTIRTVLTLSPNYQTRPT
jgi:hypothetical protein